jgi:hypothetical protein
MAEVNLPTKAEPLFTPSRYKAFYGGRGGAKSYSFAQALVLLGAQRPLRILCCREIQKSIRDSVKRLIDDRIKSTGLSHFYTSTQNEIRGANGTLILFAGLRSNPESIKSMEGIDICWVEEANTVSKRSLDLLVPTIRKEDSEIWFSWNPDSEHDPVDLMFRGPTHPPDSIILEISYKDNPWFPEVLKREMEYDLLIDKGKYKHVWLGEYADVQDGKMFPNDILEWQKQWFRKGDKVGDWKVFAPYNPKHRYAIGADVSEGVGLDSSTACLLDLTLGETAAEYASNVIEPDIFAHELNNFANKYGGCLIGVERNACGLTTVTKLNELGAQQCSEQEKESGHDKGTRKLGWRTTAKSKPLMLFDLKDAFLEKDIKLISEVMYKEVKTYNPEDLRQTRFDPEQTRHWDRVMALAIAWQMRDRMQNNSDIEYMRQAQKFMGKERNELGREPDDMREYRREARRSLADAEMNARL